MAPNGHIYFGEELRGVADWSLESLQRQGLFIHEMTHVWQHQHGVNVLLVGAYQQARQFLLGDQYAYRLEPGKTLKDYNIEQQGRHRSRLFPSRRTSSGKPLRTAGSLAY